MTNSRALRNFAFKLLWLRENKPFVYKLLSGLTDSVVLAIWLISSLGVAMLMAYTGNTPLESALMGVAIIDMNLVLFSMYKHPSWWNKELD